MHLARKSDSGDRFGRETGTLESPANCKCGSAPPVARVLLRPSRLRAGEIRVLFRARGKDRAMFAEDDSAGSAGSNIDTEDWDTASFERDLARDSNSRR